jgi:hypothetical protein
VSKNGEQMSDCWDEVLDPFYFGQELNNSPEKLDTRKKKHDNGCQHVTVYFRKLGPVANRKTAEGGVSMQFSD